MNDNDYRWQQEAEEERLQGILDALGRVDRGIATHDDATLLAAELGVQKQFSERKAA